MNECNAIDITIERSDELSVGMRAKTTTRCRLVILTASDDKRHTNHTKRFNRKTSFFQIFGV